MRRKADGRAFEREFEKCLSEKFLVRRLPTLNTGFSGFGQPADFIVVGSRFNYVEVKETVKDDFSITSMQQLEEMKQFLKDKDRYKMSGDAANEMNYWIVVHYLKRGKLRAIKAEDAIELSNSRSTLKFESNQGMLFYSLDELKRGLAL